MIPAEYIPRITEYLARKEQEMFELLRRLILCESPSGNIIVQDKIFRILQGELDKIGFYCMRIRGNKSGGILYARPLSKFKFQPFQLVLGHSDTVWPISTIEQMPFRTNERKVMGPGVYDMKAGLTQMIFSVKALYELGIKPAVLPVLLINSDEEIGSPESTTFVKKLSRMAHRALVLEPPLGLDGKLKTGRKGGKRFVITITGKAAHAGLDPEKGLNAIVEMTHVIQELFKLNDPERGISANVGMIEGGISPNIVAPKSTIHVDVRMLTNRDMIQVTKRIHEIEVVNPGFSIQIDSGPGRPPMEQTPRNRHLWNQARKVGALINLDLEEGTAGGGSDGNTTSQFTATLDGLGTTGDGAHASHEYILKDKLLERCTFLTLLLLVK